MTRSIAEYSVYKRTRVCIYIYIHTHTQAQWSMLQRKMLQRMNATTNSFINEIRMLQRMILQRTNATTKSLIQ